MMILLTNARLRRVGPAPTAPTAPTRPPVPPLPAVE